MNSRDVEVKQDKLIDYIQTYVPTTILVFNYKYKKLDKRKALGKALSKEGFLFTSDKLRDYQIPDWVNKCGKLKGLTIQPRASILLTEFLGNDISKIDSTMNKLKVIVGEKKEVNVDIVQDNIGLSKEFNLFELQNALAEKNIYKANFIINHFAQNTKNHPFVVTISSFYTFFTKLMKYHFYEGSSSGKSTCS